MTMFELLGGISLVLSSTMIAMLGSLRAAAFHHRNNVSNNQHAQAREHQDISCGQAMLFPVFASIGLMVMFFLFDYFQIFFVLYTLFLALMAIAFSLTPWAAHILEATKKNTTVSSLQGSLASLSDAPWSLWVVSGAVACLWAWTGHWLLNNIIGMGLCMIMISALRIPSMRIAAVLLIGLLIYDFYWVFVSEAHFGRNVMVAVATQKAENPIAKITQNIPIIQQIPEDWMPMPQLEMPNKFMFPVPVLVEDPEKAGAWQWAVSFMMLGLGDVVLPGLLMAYARYVDISMNCRERDAQEGSEKEEDEHVAVQVPPVQEVVAPMSLLRVWLREVRSTFEILTFSMQQSSLFRTTACGFMVGIIMSICVSRIFHAAQPALIYLVPCTLLPCLFHAWRSGPKVLNATWTGNCGKVTST